VDVDDTDCLRFVLSPTETPASQLLLKVCCISLVRIFFHPSRNFDTLLLRGIIMFT